MLENSTFLSPSDSIICFYLRSPPKAGEIKDCKTTRELVCRRIWVELWVDALCMCSLLCCDGSINVLWYCDWTCELPTCPEFLICLILLSFNIRHNLSSGCSRPDVTGWIIHARKTEKELREKTLECVESAEMGVDGGPSLLPALSAAILQKKLPAEHPASNNKMIIKRRLFSLIVCVLCPLVASGRTQKRLQHQWRKRLKGGVKDPGRNEESEAEAAVKWMCRVTVWSWTMSPQE